MTPQCHDLANPETLQSMGDIKWEEVSFNNNGDIPGFPIAILETQQYRFLQQIGIIHLRVSDYANSCVCRSSLDGTWPEHVISQEDKSPLTM